MDNQTLNQWQKSLEELKHNLSSQVPEEQFGNIWSWFENISLCERQGDTIVISVPTHAFLKTFNERYMPGFWLYLKKYMGSDLKVKYIIKEVDAAKEAKNDEKKDEVVERLDPHLNKDYTFKNFVKGVSNKAALNIAKAIADKPEQSTFNPLFLYGPSGVGKTHLVTAIGHRVLEKFPDKRVLFVSANLFKTQYMDAGKNGNTNDFMHFYQSIDVLIIDDIQELTTERTQRTFFHIFNHLQLNGRQIIITCDRPPVLFEGIEERMLTRFKWGMVLEMERPDVALRHDILNAKIRRDGLKFPREVVTYIAEHVTSNVRDLQGVVNSIMAYSIVDDCEVDLALAERVVTRVVNVAPKEMTFNDLLKRICHFYKMKPRDVLSRSRKADIAAVRQLVMYLVQKHTSLNQSQIGQEMGGRDHATILHGIRQIEKRIASDRDYRIQIEALEASFCK